MSLILVDSSVWIDFFRNGNEILEKLIVEDIICTNELILTELLPSLTLTNEKGVVEAMLAVPCFELNIDWDIIRKYQILNLENGINKIGIPDLIILEQVIEKNLTLFTLDKHFKLMQTQFQFKLLEI